MTTRPDPLVSPLIDPRSPGTGPCGRPARAALSRRASARVSARTGGRHRRRLWRSRRSPGGQRVGRAVDLRRLAAAHEPAALGGPGRAGGAAGRTAGWSPGRSRPWPRSPSRPCAVGRQLPVPVLLVGTATWDPQWSTVAPAGASRRRSSTAENGSRCGSGSSGSHAADARPGGVGRTPRASDRPRCAGPFGPAEASARLSRGTGDGGGPAAGRPGPERGRPGTAGPADRAGGRLGRPGAGADGHARAAARSRAGPGTATPVLTDWRMRRGGGRGHGVTGPVRRRLRAPARPCRPR